MPITKSIPTPYGTDATYWETETSAINHVTRQVSVTMQGWVSKEAKDGRQG